MIGNGEPEDVYVVQPDGTSVPCTVRYEGTSLGDDGQLMHDWTATPIRRLKVKPGQKVVLQIGTLPGRTSVGIEYKVKGGG